MVDAGDFAYLVAEHALLVENPFGDMNPGAGEMAIGACCLMRRNM